jgi:putative hydrolase of the HAD superfamily
MGNAGIAAVLFDYGGVIAEEGFVGGLTALADTGGLDRDFFIDAAFDLVASTGYLTGRADEAAFWKALREKTGIAGTDECLRREILARFVLRPWVLDLADDLGSLDLTVGILSDQTDWLDRLDARDGFFRHFDYVSNSFHLGLSKRDGEVFVETARRLDIPGECICLIDDNEGNCGRARECGWHAIAYRTGGQVLRELKELVSGLDLSRYGGVTADEGEAGR